MRSPSFRDMEALSAYLDGQISPSERRRLEKRLQSDPTLAASLEELRQTRELLRSTPKRRAPRNFTLTPRMAGVRPPVPRLVSVFSWASAVAVLLFMITLGSSLVGRLTPGTAAPMIAAAPSGGIGGGPPAAATQAPALAAPATAAPAAPAPAPLRKSNQTPQVTATPEAMSLSVPEAAPTAPVQNVQPFAATPTPPKPAIPWLYIWPALAALLALLALLIRWLNRLAFRRKNRGR
jgi:negative regulator of sigma E activity